MNKLIKIFVLLTCFFSLSILVSCACEHEFEESIIKEATCQYEGVKELKCRKCGYIELKQIDKISHSFQEEVLKDATCIEAGIKVKTCTVCNHKEEVEIGKNENHLFDEGVYDSKKDIFIFTCLNCSFVKEVNKEELYCENHSFNEGKVIKEANCFEDGIMEYSCSNCLFKKTEVINKLNHNLVKVDGYDATCYDEGRKTFYHCIYCQNNYDEENNQLETVVIDVLEHNYVTYDGFTMCEHCHEYDVLFISSINEENKISKRYDKDLKAVIVDNLLTEDNYSFVSWNSKKDGSGDSYQAGLEYDYLPNKLYAIYTDATSFEITFLDHEGNLITKETVKYNEMPTAPTLSFVKPTAEGKKEYVWNKELTKAVKNETYQAVLSDCVVLSVTEALERNSGEYIYVKGIVAGAGYKIIQAAVLLKDSENDNLINMVLMPGNTDNKNPKFVGFKIGDEFIIRCKVEVAKESTADKGDKYLSFADFGSTNSDYVVRENVNIEYDYSKALEITTQEELIKFVNSNPSESLDKIVKLSGTIYVNFYSGNLRLSLDGGDSATSYQVFSPTTATRKTYLFFRGTYGDFNTGTDFKELVLGISKDVDTADGIFPTGVFFGDLYFVILGADGYNRYATLLNASGAVRKVKYHQGTVEKVSIYDGKAPTLESLGITLEDGIIFKEWNTLADGTGASFKEGDDMNKYY